jgi:hypothetical protein
MGKGLWQAHFMTIQFFNTQHGGRCFRLCFFSLAVGIYPPFAAVRIMANPLFNAAPFPHILESEAGFGAGAGGLPAAC